MRHTLCNTFAHNIAYLKAGLFIIHPNSSHFAVPTAQLYGWLPLSDAYGIAAQGTGSNFVIVRFKATMSRRKQRNEAQGL